MLRTKMESVISGTTATCILWVPNSLNRFHWTRLMLAMRETGTISKWNSVVRAVHKLDSSFRFPPEKSPVLEFTNAPGRFPISHRDVHLQKYFQWSEMIEYEVDKFLKEVVGKERFLGVHLRNGADWIQNSDECYKLCLFLLFQECACDVGVPN
jgi:hypothetical protein